MGVWLLVFEKRRACGLFALAAGAIWFLLATQWIIPSLSGAEAAAVDRYEYLGNSVLEVAKNLLLQPGIILSKLRHPGVSGRTPVSFGVGAFDSASRAISQRHSRPNAQYSFRGKYSTRSRASIFAADFAVFVGGCDRIPCC
jgi:Predicted membrane protein (DUF2079)